MARPLVVTDCDEVLLHMVRHFRNWLAEEHEIDFALKGDPFIQSLSRRNGTRPLTDEEVWNLLDQFFVGEMARQTAIEGSVEAIRELQREADVVVLTNLADHFAESRQRQLADHGLQLRVYTNKGPKGAALRRIVEEYRPARAVFIDDIAKHHASAAEEVPEIGRLHFCGEPAIAGHVPCAFTDGHAHARIDTWQEALPWLLERLHGVRP